MWKIRPYNTNDEQSFVDNGQHPLLARLLAQRNIDIKTVNDFIACEYSKLSHPHTLGGVKQAARLFGLAYKFKKTIAVIGDYDCDGIISSSMVYELCSSLNMPCEVFLPCRKKHGYGLNEKTIKAFKYRFKDSIPQVLFIVDSGSNNEKEVKELKEFGIEHIIIIDHHLVDPNLQSVSADALINWRLCGSNEMCTCGEVFQLIKALRLLTDKVNPLEFLSYAAIGTLADATSLNIDNRIIVRNGLKESVLNNVISSGINAIKKASKIYSTDLSATQVLFKIAPKINAVGRLATPDLAFDLITEHDIGKAEEKAMILEVCNEERKKVQKAIEKKAIKMVKDNIDDYKYGIAVYHEEWHIGVIGIVASKLTEEFNKPTIIAGNLSGIWKGSGRSVEQINVKEILDKMPKEMMLGYGGHPMAVGYSVKEEHINKLNEEFNKACKSYYDEHEIVELHNYYDISIKPQAITYETARLLQDSLSPYSTEENPEPIFKIKDAIITDASLIERDTWKLLKFYVERDGYTSEIEFTMFTDQYGIEINGQKVDVYFTFPILTDSRYGNDITVKDIVGK